MPGIKLFVDDRRLEPQGWTLCRTINEAQRLLFHGDVEEISLDHDINWYRHRFEHEDEDHFSIPVDERYMAIVYFLIILPPDRRPKKVNIHTGNAGAKDQMVSMLTMAGYEGVTTTSYGF